MNNAPQKPTKVRRRLKPVDDRPGRPVSWKAIGGINRGEIGQMVILPPKEGKDIWTIVMMAVLQPGNRWVSTQRHHMVKDVPLLLNSLKEPRYPGTSRPQGAMLRVAGDNAWLVLKATDRDVLIETAAMIDGFDALRAWEEHEAVQQALAPSTQKMIEDMEE